MTRPARPQFNPSRLVTIVMEVLGGRFNIGTTVDSTTVGPAVNAAADLLRALGIMPTNAPELRDPTTPGIDRCPSCGEVRGEDGHLFHVDGCPRSVPRPKG